METREKPQCSVGQIRTGVPLETLRTRISVIIEFTRLCLNHARAVMILKRRYRCFLMFGILPANVSLDLAENGCSIDIEVIEGVPGPNHVQVLIQHDDHVPEHVPPELVTLKPDPARLKTVPVGPPATLTVSPILVPAPL